ncbi:MAG: glycosyltransferase family 4 protein [Pseudohongiellaceae bacterium]
MKTAPLYFVYPGDLDTPTGGYRYDRRLIDELRKTGMEVITIALSGTFPFPDLQAIMNAREALASLADDSVVLVDGLALGVLNDIAKAEARRLRLLGLCHHPLALESGLDEGTRQRFYATEKSTLTHVRGVVVTSANTRDILINAFDVPSDHITVALPGTDRMPFARCDGDPQRLLTVASLTPRKAHDVLIDALAPLASLDWTARFVGSSDFDPDWARGLTEKIENHRLSDRITFAGTVTKLDAEYASGDVFVLPSRFEGYGMVFAEALAAGLPVIATDTGAIPSVVPASAGLLVPPDNAPALTDALRQLLTDASLRRRLQSGAQMAAAKLPTWEETAQQVVQLLNRVNPA